VHPAHRGQVDHEAAVADGVAGHVVAAAADGDLEAALAAEAHGRLHVGGAVAAGHEGRPPINQPVVNTPGVLVRHIRRRQDGAGDLRAKDIARMSFSRHREAPHRRKAPRLGPVASRRGQGVATRAGAA
jgi:hypothetical protein